MSKLSSTDSSLLAAQSDLDCDIAAAMGLPGSLYTTEEFYQRERGTIFKRGWIATAMASEVPSAGDVLVRMVAGTNVVITRDPENRIRCFYNLCRHRGMAVATASCSKQRALHCAWHGWSYGLDGHLRSTPELAGPGAAGAPGNSWEDVGLVPIRTARWFDFVFINLDADAQSLEHFLSPLTRRFAQFGGFRQFRHASSWRHVYECNWKIAVEGAIEDYHLPCVHPQITRGNVRADHSDIEVGGDCYFLVSSRSASIAKGRTSAAVRPLPRVAGLDDEAARTTYFLNIFPSGIMGIAPDGLYTGVWLPDGPHRTQLHFHFYFVGEEGAKGPDHQAARTEWTQMICRVFDQDSPIVKAVHENARTRDEAGVRTRFSPFWETAVHAFQRRVMGAVTV